MLGNCVGHGNYRYFLSYSLYSCLVSLTVLVIAFDEVRKMLALDIFGMRTTVGRLILVYFFALLMAPMNAYLLITHCCVLINNSSQFDL